MKEKLNIEINSIILNKYFKVYLKNEMSPYSINSSESLVILMLYTNEFVDFEEFKSTHFDLCATQDQLINELHFDKGVMTRIMKSLEEKGFVTRDVNPNDSRSFVFSLTKSGIEIKKEIVKVLKKWSDSVFDGVDDIEKVCVAISKMTRNAQKLF